MRRAVRFRWNPVILHLPRSEHRQALRLPVPSAECHGSSSQNCVSHRTDPKHLLIKIHNGGINGEHTCCLTDAQHLFSGQLPVNVSCQCGEECDILHMIFSAQNSLIQMCNAPSRGMLKLNTGISFLQASDVCVFLQVRKGTRSSPAALNGI